MLLDIFLACGAMVAENNHEVSLEKHYKKQSAKNEELLKRLGEFSKVWNTKNL